MCDLKKKTSKKFIFTFKDQKKLIRLCIINYICEFGIINTSAIVMLFLKNETAMNS